jgi:hypothetical protein
VELKNWEDAEAAGTEFAELTSQLEILKEQLREFCARRHDAVGKARVVGPVIVGFRRVSASVRIVKRLADQAVKWVRTNLGGDFIVTIPSIDKGKVKKDTRFWSEKRWEEALAAGLICSAAGEVFYVHLANCHDEEDEDL